MDKDEMQKRSIDATKLREWVNFYKNNSSGVRTNKHGPSAKEEELQEKKKEALELEALEIGNKGQILDQRLKEKIFGWVRVVVACYLIFMSVIICFSLPLTENTLIALFTTTTINVLGLPAFIIHSLFPKIKKEDKR
jgi:hypothetical protein